MWTRICLCFSLSLCILSGLWIFRTQILWKENNLGGLTYIRSDQGSLKGHCSNEFGVGFFSFSIKEGGRVKIEYLHKVLRKPFVKKTLKRDLKLLFVDGAKIPSSAKCTKTGSPDNSDAIYKLEHLNIPLTIEMIQIKDNE